MVHSHMSKSKGMFFAVCFVAVKSARAINKRRLKMGLILLIILLLLLFGFPLNFPYSRGWGYRPMGLVGVLLVVILVLVFFDVLSLGFGLSHPWQRPVIVHPVPGPLRARLFCAERLEAVPRWRAVAGLGSPGAYPNGWHLRYSRRMPSHRLPTPVKRSCWCWPWRWHILTTMGRSSTSCRSP